VSLLCTILPGKAIPEMTFTVSGGMLNPTHSRTHWMVAGILWFNVFKFFCWFFCWFC